MTISSDADNKTTVKCGKTEFSFMGIDSEEYPELPSVDGRKSYKIKQGVLKNMINQSIFAVSDNDSRPVYTGSMFEVENGFLAMVSVDGYRLAIRREAIEGPEEHNEFIVPGSALSDIERISANDSEEDTGILSEQTMSRSPSAALLSCPAGSRAIFSTTARQCPTPSRCI